MQWSAIRFSASMMTKKEGKENGENKEKCGPYWFVFLSVVSTAWVTS
jgi:hypothetical protein